MSAKSSNVQSITHCNDLVALLSFGLFDYTYVIPMGRYILNPRVLYNNLQLTVGKAMSCSVSSKTIRNENSSYSLFGEKGLELKNKAFIKGAFSSATTVQSLIHFRFCSFWTIYKDSYANL